MDSLDKTREKTQEAYDKITKIALPSLSYPDCEFCDCAQGQQTAPLLSTVQDNGLNDAYDALLNSLFSDLTETTTAESYEVEDIQYSTPNNSYENLFAGQAIGISGSTVHPITPQTRAPQYQEITSGSTTSGIFTTSLPLYERINLFNNKSKYEFRELNH